MAARVLVVDDEKAVCAVLQDVLEMEGYEAEVCHDVDTARARLAEGKFDVALLDVFLSNGPVGVELGREILEESPQTSLLFMTGYAEDVDVQAGYAFGAYACIKKPFELDDIVRVIGVALDGKTGG